MNQNQKIELISWSVAIGIHLVLFLLPITGKEMVAKSKPVQPVAIRIKAAPPLPKKVEVLDPGEFETPVLKQVEPKKKEPVPNRVQKHVKKVKQPKASVKAEVSRGISHPFVVLERVQPIYPKAALNLGLEGRVKVSFVLDDKGHVMGHRIVKSSGHEVLDAIFVRTVSESYKIKPEMKDGVPVSGNMVLEYEFKL